MKLVRPIGCSVAAVAAAAMLAAGCGSSSDEDSASTSAGTTAAAASDATATVFDGALRSFSAADLPAASVDVGGGTTIRFDAGEKPRIAYVGFGLGFDYTVPQYKAAKDAAAEYGVELDTFDPNGDGQKQVQQLQDIMSGGRYDVIVTYPVTADLTCDLLSRQAPSRNLLVVAHNQAVCAGDEATDGVLSTVWDPNTPKGLVLWARHIAADQGADGKGQKAIVVTGAESDTSSNDAVRALEEVFGEAGIEIVSLQRTDYTSPDAQRKAQDALQANPDATMMVATFPEGTRGAVSAIEIAGKTRKLRVYDLGGSSKTIRDIENGIVTGSSPLFPATLARTAVQAALLGREGREVPRAIFNAGVDGLAEDEVPWVDADSAASFHPEH